jgi:D-alanyl-D-alanine carboxypeptidase
MQLLLALVPALLPQAAQDEPVRDLDRLEAVLSGGLAELREARGFPGATAAFCFDDGATRAVAVGFSDLERELAMEPNSRMLAGSTGKTFVAAVVLQLVDEGELGLDDPIAVVFGEEEWFAELPGAEQVTLRSLLGHTSGIADHVWAPEFHAALAAEPDRAWSPEELVAFVLGRDPLFPVGEGFAYADTNFVLAAMMVERVTGHGYYAELRERLLEPYQLVDTLPQDTRVLPGLVPGYTTEGNPFGLPRKVAQGGRHAMNPQLEHGGGGVMSTSADLARWAVALYHGGAIPPDLMGEVLESRPAPRVGPGMEYGLGVVVGRDSNGPHWGHTGWFPGYGTVLAYYPERGLGFALQVNTDDGSQLAGFPHGWAEALVAALIRENRREN